MYSDSYIISESMVTAQLATDHLMSHWCPNTQNVTHQGETKLTNLVMSHIQYSICYIFYFNSQFYRLVPLSNFQIYCIRCVSMPNFGIIIQQNGTLHTHTHTHLLFPVSIDKLDSISIQT